MMKFSQGHLASCQTLAAIGSLALNASGKQMLEKMIRKGADGYEVTFPKHPEQPIKVTPREYKNYENHENCGPLNGSEPYSKRAIDVLKKEFSGSRYVWFVYQDRPHHVSGDELVRVLEVAYAKYQKFLHPKSFEGVLAEDPLAVFRHRSFHYRADECLRDFTDWEVETVAAGNSPSSASHSFAQKCRDKPALIQTVMDKLKELSKSPERFVVTACSTGSSMSNMFLDPGGKVLPWHEHIVASIDAEAQTINLVDPYNSRITMILHYEDFFQYFYLLCIAKGPISL
jgi:hypothetical protein